MVRMITWIGAVIIVGAVPVAAGEISAATRETALAVSGMLCSSCSDMVEKTVKKLDGVSSAHADIRTDRVTVRYDATKVTPLQMVEALRKAGYQARWPEGPAPQGQTPKR